MLLQVYDGDGKSDCARLRSWQLADAAVRHASQGELGGLSHHHRNRPDCTTCVMYITFQSTSATRAI